MHESKLATDRALAAARQLLALEAQIGCAAATRSRTLFDAFQLGIRRRSTLNEALGFLREAYDLNVAMYSPTSSEPLRMKALLADPSRNVNCLFEDMF